MRFLLQIRYVFIILGILSLTSCTSMFGSYSTAVSNKNPDTAIQKPVNQHCNNWCHNGWCSTHCEPTTSQTN